jgi:hypothetical protein
LRQAVIVHIAHKTTRTVTALFDFPAIGIEDAITEIGLTLGFLDQQNLIASDAEMAVGQFTELLTIQCYGLMDTIENDKIVTQTLHFGEFQFHRSIRSAV